MRFKVTKLAWIVLGAAATVGLVLRVYAASKSAYYGDLDPARAIGFSVIFPLSLAFVVLAVGASRSREGALMRLATAMQMILIVFLPAFSLHLVLGLPVAFLIVEAFETRLPATIRDALTGPFVQ